jgi:hypothetical protein
VQDAQPRLCLSYRQAERIARQLDAFFIFDGDLLHVAATSDSASL